MKAPALSRHPITMLGKLTVAVVTLAATVLAHCPQNSCSDALLQNPSAAAALCQKFEKAHQPSPSSSAPGSCPSAGASCVCTPSSPLPYPEFAAPCFEKEDFAQTLKESCECVSNVTPGSSPGQPNQPGGSAGPSQGSTAPGGETGHGGASSPGSPAEGAGHGGSTSPSGSSGQGTSPSSGENAGHGGSSPQAGVPGQQGSGTSGGAPGHEGSASPGGQSPGQGPITTSSVVTTEMYVNPRNY